jgi:hypothetical protein
MGIRWGIKASLLTASIISAILTFTLWATGGLGELYMIGATIILAVAFVVGMVIEG